MNFLSTGQNTSNNTRITYVDLNLEQVMINREEYEELQADSRLLWALLDEGVDNWEGYDRAVLKA